MAVDDGVDRERVSFQVVDEQGNPLPYQRYIYVDMSSYSNVLIREQNNNDDLDNPTVVNATSTLLQTDVSGLGWITLSRTNTTDGSVTVTPVTNGDMGSSELARDNETVDILFADRLAPTISSADFLLFQSGSAQDLPDVTVTERQTGNITVVNDIRIRIPDSLDAVFDTAAVVNTSVSGGNQGAVQSGVSYESGDKVAVVDVITSDFDTDRAVTVTGLRFTSVNSVSSGRLELSYDGGASTR
ncbi:MAG TPA: hypothetical protein ENN41_02265 [Sediminispirochaeta sp.]|nr:hypothetical protein [Sediminispirochaeta sp.]